MHKAAIYIRSRLAMEHLSMNTKAQAYQLSLAINGTI